MYFEKQPFRMAFDDARRRADEKAKTEKFIFNEGSQPWRSYNSSILNYEARFSEVIPESFTEFLARRKASKGKIFALDVMGTGRFSQVYPVDGEVAITLYDGRDDKQIQIDNKNNRIVIGGDVLRNETWHKAHQFITGHDNTNFPGFDLIICSPLAGWGIVEGNPKYVRKKNRKLLRWIVVQQMFNTLAVGGRLLVEHEPFDRQDRNWLRNLNSLPGIEVESGRDSFRLDKFDNSVKILPKI